MLRVSPGTGAERLSGYDARPTSHIHKCTWNYSINDSMSEICLCANYLCNFLRSFLGCKLQFTDGDRDFVFIFCSLNARRTPPLKGKKTNISWMFIDCILPMGPTATAPPRQLLVLCTLASMMMATAVDWDENERQKKYEKRYYICMNQHWRRGTCIFAFLQISRIDVVSSLHCRLPQWKILL